MDVGIVRRGIDCIGVSAVALVHDGNGSLLLQKRGSEARDERGAWDLCGGAVEFNETIEQTIKRELEEELSTQALDMRFLTIYDAFRKIEGQSTHWIAVVYAVRVDPRTVAINEPHKISEIGWFHAATLPSPTHSQFSKSFAAAQMLGLIS